MYHTYKYRVSALDFIAKNYSDIHDELQKDIQQVQKYLQINNTEKPFTYKDYSNTININFMNINYFESNSINSHSSILNTVNNQQLKLNYNLRDIEKLDNRFFRAHRSYLVNVKLKLESTQKDRSRYQLWLFFTKISFKQLHEERFEYFQVSNS